MLGDRQARNGTASAPAAEQRLRVLFVHTATLPPLGADTWVHAKIMAALDRSAHEIHVACATGAPESPTPTFQMLRAIPDLHVVPVDFGPELFNRTSLRARLRGLLAALAGLASLAKLAVYIRRNRISVIHTSDRPRDASACVLLARLTRTRCIVHSHVAFDDTWMSPLLQWSLNRADARIAVSEFVADSLVESGHRGDSTYVVLNAIEPGSWEPGQDRATVRRELGVPDDAPVIITVCRLFPAKGPVELIRALELVRKELPETRLVIVGHDLTQDGSFEQALIELTRELGVVDHVVFTGRRSDVPRLMAAADVFAMPSFEEPFGLVYLEAMAMKLPVVALDTGGTPEVVEHGRSGLLCRRGDIDDLATSLTALLRDPERREEMGAYGRRQVESRFTTDRMARDTAAVYRQVVS